MSTSTTSSTSAPKKRPAEEKRQSDEQQSMVNTEKASRGVWLVKVPRYLSEVWEQNAGGVVGKLVTGRGETTFHSEIAGQLAPPQPASHSSFASTSASSSQNSLQKYSQSIPQPVRAAAPSTTTTQNAMQIPTQHKFIIRDLNSQSMAVLSEDKSALEEEADLRTGKLSIEGRIVCRADCQPPNSTDYMRMKIAQIQRVSQPKKTVKQMDRAVVKFKPVNAHQEHQVKEKQRKEGTRAIRLERDEVVSLLFNAFERHQFYRQADLQRIVNQPATVVREVLNDIGLYHDSAPHRSMWELKPEYRNYSKQLAKNVEQKMQQQQQKDG
ncbi:hypothetical protein niasHT_036067 [Heterodera trifolii]|uniref:General transcription factor IIF subunit 2 n=1 Tax=Heterodera trifolii TaxID=157864 RepID=A0ABD2IME0_9BILA